MKKSFSFLGIDVLKDEKRQKTVPTVTAIALMYVIASHRPREFCRGAMP